MLRRDASGRVPFSLVAVLLLISAGLASLSADKLRRDESADRAREASLAALGQVADDVDRELRSQAQNLALAAIAAGSRGLVNETRASDTFRHGFREYLDSHFPRIVRSATVRITATEANLGLALRRVVDVQPSNATRAEEIDGQVVAIPDPAAPESLAPIDRLAYFAVRGTVGYPVAGRGVSLARSSSLETVVPVPAPLMEATLERATRAGQGDLAGVGKTVKAILASLAQFRILDGVASPVHAGTTTRDVLTVADVEFAVNIALLLEEVRAFRAYDVAAASALDAHHPPPTADRAFARLLDRYAANGTLDASDLFAIYEGLDARGVSMASVFAQALAAIGDDLILRPLDSLGLTPLADWLTNATIAAADAIDSFLSWLTGQPDRYARYVLQFVTAVFVDTNAGTGFFGPLPYALPARTYGIPGRNGTISIGVPAHAVSVGFPAKDLLASEYNTFWRGYFPRLRVGAGAVGATLRTLVNDVSANLAHDAVLAGLLPGTATGRLDPGDGSSFLDALSEGVDRAVDAALARFRSDPYSVDALTATFWEATKAMLRDLVDYLGSGYDAVLVNKTAETSRAQAAITDDLFGFALRVAPPLNASQRAVLRLVVDVDVTQNGWAADAFRARKGADLDAFGRALALADATTLPGQQLRTKMRQALTGAEGWLAAASTAVKGFVDEAARAQGAAGPRAQYRTTLGPFSLGDPWTGGPDLVERFRVHQTPTYLAATPGPIDVGTNEGVLHLEITDPASLPASSDSPNAHVAKLGALSRAPFTTAWRVRVAGAVRLALETSTPVLLGGNGLVPMVLEKTWALNFSLTLVAYSGWNLTGVSYRPSDSLLNEVASFLARAAWDVATIVRWFVAVLGRAFEVMWQLMERLSDFATKVVRLLGELLTRGLDLLRMLTAQGLGILGRIADAALATFPGERRFTIVVGGLVVHGTVNGPAGRRVRFDVEGSGPTRIELVRLAESEFRSRAPATFSYDVLVRSAGSVGPLRQAVALDPLNVTQPHVVEGNATWDGAWRANYSGPSVLAGMPIDVAAAISVPVATGVNLDIKVGIEALTIGLPLQAFLTGIGRSLSEGFDDVPAITSWESVGHLIRAIGVHLRTNVLDAIEGSVLEVSLYAQVDIKAEVVGGGVRLAFVVDGAGLRIAAEWLIDNIATYFENGLDPLAAADYAAMPDDLEAHAALRAELHFVTGAPAVAADFGIIGEVRIAARLQPNLAAIARLVGLSWGHPAYEFALLLDGHVALAGLPGLYGVLYLLRGSIVPE